MAVPLTMEPKQPKEWLRFDRSKLVNALIVVLVGLILWFIPPVGKLKPEVMHLTAIFIATILGLILQPLPQGAVVILGVALALG